MKLLIDSFWRAALYCLHPKVILLSLLPLALMTAMALGLGYFYWEAAIDGVRLWLDNWNLLQPLRGWLEAAGWGGMWASLAPLLVVLAATPVIVVLSLLLVAAMMTPAMARLVAARRFPQLERRQGGSFAGGAASALGCTALAMLALLLSIPLWFIPPLVLVVPPLVWGWLTYKVMCYDVLADHATKDERRALVREHRPALLGMGVLTGYLGAAPSLVFASSVLTVLMAPVLVPLAIWIYTLVFAFSSLWFAHYLLAALAAHRAGPQLAAALAAGGAAEPASQPSGGLEPAALPPVNPTPLPPL